MQISQGSDKWRWELKVHTQGEYEAVKFLLDALELKWGGIRKAVISWKDSETHQLHDYNDELQQD